MWGGQDEGDQKVRVHMIKDFQNSVTFTGDFYQVLGT